MQTGAQKFMLAGVKAFALTLFLTAGAFSAVAQSPSLSKSPSTVYPGATVTVTATLTYGSGDQWGSFLGGVAVQKDGNTCNWAQGTVSGSSAGGASISASCIFTAGAADSTFSANSAYNVNGGAWIIQSPPSIYTVSSLPVASASISKTSPTSSPVPYNSNVYLAVSSQNAKECSVTGGGSWYSHDTYYTSGSWVKSGVTSDTLFEVSCKANSNTTGTPTGSITVTVKPSDPTPNGTLSPTGNVTPGTALSLTGSVTNASGATPYTGTNCWEYKVNSGTRTSSCWTAAGSGVGTVTAKNWNAGDADPTNTYTFYLCAGSVCSSAGSLTVVKVDPVITWANFSMAYGGSITAPTASVAGSFSYATAGANTSDYSVGTRDITATFTPTDTATYNTVARAVTMTVTKADQTITFGTLSGKTLGDAPFGVSASASSGLGVSFSSQTGSICSVSGSTVTLLAVGTCTIRAAQAGNTNYNAATLVDQSFTVVSGFNYSLSDTTGVTLIQGGTATKTITATLSAGTTQNVTLSASGLPTGVTASFATNPVSPTGTSVVTFTAASNAAIGTFQVTVTGSPFGRTVTFNLAVSAPVSAVINNFDAAEPIVYNNLTFLRWGSSNTSGCTLNGGPYSNKSVGVSETGINYQTGQLTQDTTFTLSCSPTNGAIGNPNQTFTVRVLPQKPSLSVASGACGGITTSKWDGANLASGYKLHRSPSGTAGTFSQLPVGSPTNVTSPYNDSGLTIGDTYYYQLEAVNSAGSSYSVVQSSAASATCALPPNLTVGAFTIYGTRSMETNDFMPSSTSTNVSYSFVVAVNNAGGTATGPVTAKFSVQRPGGVFDDLGADPELNDNVTALGASKSVNLSYYGYGGTDIEGSWNVKVCVSTSSSVPESDSSDSSNCGTASFNVVRPQPSTKPPSCTATINNTTSDTGGAWTTSVGGTVNGCPLSRYRKLIVGGEATVNNRFISANPAIFEFKLGTPRTYVSCTSSDPEGSVDTVKLMNAGGNAITGGGGGTTCGQGTLLIGNNTWNQDVTALNARTIDQVFGNGFTTTFGYSNLEPGNYSYAITEHFTGDYACTLGGNTTYYHAECDPLSGRKANGGTDSVCQSGTVKLETVALPNPDWEPWSAPTSPDFDSPALRLCVTKDINSTQTGYYDFACSAILSSTRYSAPVMCGTVPVWPSVTVTANQPTTPPARSFMHNLNVNSTLDTSPAPGVAITQEPGGTSPSMDGTTNYSKSPQTNINVVLRAPDTGPSSSSFAGWSGCDDDTTLTDSHLCRVKMDFTYTGSQPRTITAKYTAAVSPTTLNSAGGSCGGKTNLWWTANGADSYRLYRSTDPNWNPSGPTDTTNLVGAFTTGFTSAAPYIDTDPAANTNYSYKLLSVRNSRASAASASVSKSSDVCPPPAPTGVSAVASCANSGQSDGSVTITWKAGTGTAGVSDGPTDYYRVYDNQISVREIASLSTKFANLSGSISHSYQIKSVGPLVYGSNSNHLESDFSSPAVQVTIPTCLTQPVVTTAPGYCGRTVKLTLTPSTGATSYELSRSPFSVSDSGYGVIKPFTTLPSTYYNYVEPAFASSRTFTYQVKASAANLPDTYSDKSAPASTSASSVPCGVELYVMP